MRSIIRQTPSLAALPDFRNLGTVLRVLLAVNAIGAIAAIVVEPRWLLWSAAWLDVLAYLEPCLMTELLVLYLLQPVFERSGYRAGVALILAVTVAIVIAVDAVLPRALPLPPTNSLRHVVLAVLLTSAMLAYFQLRAKALSPAITEARLQALQARIRPHFLFNSINAVLSLVRTEPKRAETALEDMADLFRVLMRDNRELAPLSDEVELCRQYLELEKLRLGDRLRVEWHLQSMPGDALVPPLVLQPILENAVYHGIEPSSTPGVVSINIFYKSGDVHAIVRNPYRVDGGRHHGGNKMALGNVRERLALHFDAEANLASRVKADAYEVHIRMPYRSAETRRAAQQASAHDLAAAHGTPLTRPSQRTRGRLHFPTPEASRG
ncbi:MAG TPA: histidine kinase [Casimicrobiaceae bacterium]|nr:histidine kinase [Casimicrobiaceae bacterium]